MTSYLGDSQRTVFFHQLDNFVKHDAGCLTEILESDGLGPVTTFEELLMLVKNVTGRVMDRRFSDRQDAVVEGEKVTTEADGRHICFHLQSLNPGAHISKHSGVYIQPCQGCIACRSIHL